MWVDKALGYLKAGQALAAAAKIAKACERRAAKGLCASSCQKCRLEKARMALMAGRVSRTA
ncbi:MAG: hypothetical protein HPY71_06925 [Firmicutes bacterium]|nr:hypothetical protein [Bacillota bacterium]